MRGLLRRVEPEEMGSGPIAKTLLILALPAAGSGVLHTAFEFLDMMFISWLGADQVSGVSLMAPVMMAVWAAGNAAAAGVSAVCSRQLGANDLRGARETLNHGLGIAAIVGGAVSVVGLLFVDRLMDVMGARGPIRAFALEYISTVLYAPLFMHLGMVADSGLRAQGNTVTPLKITAAGNLANIALDVLLIFVLGLGVRGAALATVAARTAMSLVLVARLWAPYSRVTPGPVPGRRLFGSLPVIGRIYWIGLPATVGVLAMSASVFVINTILLSLNEVAVGVMGVAWRLEMFAFTPIFGLFSAVVPMVGYNLGARQFARCAAVVRSACAIAALGMGVLGFVLFAFPRTFMQAFGKDELILDMGAQYLRINCWAYALVACDIMISAAFQGLGKSYISMLVQLWRNLCVKIAAAWFLSRIAGVVGVWWCFPISTVFSLSVASWLMTITLRRLSREPAPEPLVPTPPAPPVAQGVAAQMKSPGK